ncbi:late embryogenesis abundant protein At5g17165-like [Primulina eburnea]|uniref:late embryogenesis abundant protein At5g17165-like n=1 Tax=Primulina eburnea TaxID=1245227 RepID=UPI003C6C831B
MAANFQSRGLASFSKQLVSRVRSRDSTVIRIYGFADGDSLRYRYINNLSDYSNWRGVHVSTYDKNPDEDHSHSAVVPDNVIPSQTQQYWAPHPKTGVFGPAKEGPALADEDGGSNGGTDSVLEQKAFFRPLEDLDKPHHP